MQTGRQLAEVCEEVSWPLYRKYGHAHDAFRMAVGSEEDIFPESACHFIRPCFIGPEGTACLR